MLLVLTNCRDIFSWEGIGGVRNQEAGLSYCSISNNDALDVLHFFLRESSGVEVSLGVFFPCFYFSIWNTRVCLLK